MPAVAEPHHKVGPKRADHLQAMGLAERPGDLQQDLAVRRAQELAGGKHRVHRADAAGVDDAHD